MYSLSRKWSDGNLGPQLDVSSVSSAVNKVLLVWMWIKKYFESTPDMYHQAYLHNNRSTWKYRDTSHILSICSGSISAADSFPSTHYLWSIVPRPKICQVAARQRAKEVRQESKLSTYWRILSISKMIFNRRWAFRIYYEYIISYIVSTF